MHHPWWRTEAKLVIVFTYKRERERKEEQKSVLTMVISYDKNLDQIKSNLLFPF